MKRCAKLPLPGLAEARHLARFGTLQSIEAIDLRHGDVIAAEVLENYTPFKPYLSEWFGGTPRQTDTRTDAQITAALKAYPIKPEAQADAAEYETARRLLLKERGQRRKARARAARAKLATNKQAEKEASSDRRVQEESRRIAAHSLRLWSLRGGR